jgi:hypothetical protein
MIEIITTKKFYPFYIIYIYKHVYGFIENDKLGLCLRRIFLTRILPLGSIINYLLKQLQRIFLVTKYIFYLKHILVIVFNLQKKCY